MRKIMALGLAPALLIGIVPAPTALASSQDSDEAVKTSAYGLTDDYVLFVLYINFAYLYSELKARVPRVPIKNGSSLPSEFVNS